MLTLLLTAILTSTSADVAPRTDAGPRPGVLLARQLRRDLDHERLRPSDAVARFVALERPEREACLTEWARITEPQGAALVITAKFRAVRDEPVVALRPAASEAEQSARPSAVVLPGLSYDQLERLRSGSRLHGIGGGFVAGGVLSMVGSLLAGAAAAVNDDPMWPAGVGLGVGAIITGIGAGIMAAGDRDFRAAGGFTAYDVPDGAIGR